MHSEADVHGTIQIGRGFGLAQSGAGDSEVVHADIIGTGGDDLRGKVDTALTGTSVVIINRCMFARVDVAQLQHEI